MITSPNHELLKEVRKLAGRRWRDKLGRFTAEGEDLLEAAEAAGWQPVATLVAADSGLQGEPVAPHLLAQVSQLGSGARTIAIFDQRFAPALGRRCVALWGVGDPGNVGTVLRSAHAFGATAVALGPGTADPFSPKAVRASMGAVFAVGVRRVRSVPELPAPRLALAGGAGATLAEVVADARGGADGGFATLLVGAEREGLPDDARAACDAEARIPITGDSLNAAMAATVALYATAPTVDGTGARTRPVPGSEADKVGNRA